MHVTRIAPSPTGFMHLGTGRTALFNWLAARATGGRFILRIDDTDADRNRPEAVQPILDGLTWLGLDWDELHRQSDRTDIYRAQAARLLDAGHATRADNGAVLLKWQPFMPRSWHDMVGGTVQIRDDTVADQIDGLVLLRGGDKQDQATYQFSSVVDDYLMGVNLVIRGVDHIANTGKQAAVWAALAHADAPAPIDGLRQHQTAMVGALFPQRPLPEFAHVGLIFMHKKKMSKRDGAASLLDYRGAGCDPDAMFNFLLRMGWGPKVDDKSSTFIDRDRAKELFLEHGNMRAAQAGFDEAKLQFYDRSYKKFAARTASSPSP